MPRQGVLNQNSKGTVKLNLENAPQCLEGLEGFSHIWLIYIFHQNQNWKPMVSPPRIHPKKVGVLASRAPYRPNQIGMSLVKLDKVNKSSIEVSEFDLLDQTPIIDIKPYIHYSDSRQTSEAGWIKPEKNYVINYTEESQQQAQWLYDKAGIDLFQIIKTQLQYRPTDQNIKRISQKNNQWTLCYRTWRIHYTTSNLEVTIVSISSGYSKEEILHNTEDKYQDKSMHKDFLSKWKI